MTVKNTDTMETPGPQSIETFELLHGGKQDTKSHEAKLDQLISDFRERLNLLVAVQDKTDKECRKLTNIVT